MARNVVVIGESVLIKGELSATEDLTVEGQVEGKIHLDNRVLTIGRNGRITAEVIARVVNVIGKVEGHIRATEVIDIRESATVDGALAAPRIGIAEGASLRGQVDISVSVPLQSVIKRLKPEKRHVRFLRQLLGRSIATRRPDATPVRLFGTTPKLAEATMRLHVEGHPRGSERGAPEGLRRSIAS